MKIVRVQDGEDLAAWEAELDRCLKSDYPGAGDYPPGAPQASVAANYLAYWINVAANYPVQAIALWCPGGALWAYVYGDPLVPDLINCHETLTRARDRGVYMALRTEAVRIAKEMGASTYYAWVADHAGHPDAIAKAPAIMKEWGAEPWSRCWAKPL